MGDVGREVDISRVLRRDRNRDFTTIVAVVVKTPLAVDYLMSRTVTGITGTSFTGY